MSSHPSSSSSPAYRAAQQPPTQGSSPTANISSQPISLDSLLRSHATDPSPVHAALEHILSDRNTLAAQNSQLWKLIEKQRQGYNHIIKELERVRGERDVYRARLQALAPQNGSTRMHQSSDATRPSSRSKSNGSQESNPRGTLSRHHSDDLPTPRGTQQIHATRSQEPLSPTSNEGNKLKPLPTVSAPSKPQPHPLLVPPRAESLPFPASGTSATSETAPLNQITSSRPSPQDATTSHDEQWASQQQTHLKTSHSAQPAMTPQTAPPGFTGSQLSSTENTRAPSSLLTPIASTSGLLGVHPPDLAQRALSRDSRISLPDEARQYIANMVDSPLPSPQLSTSAQSRTRGISNLSQIDEAGDAEAPQSTAPSLGVADTSVNVGSEFLDLDDDEYEEYEGAPGEDQEYNAFQRRNHSRSNTTDNSAPSSEYNSQSHMPQTSTDKRPDSRGESPSSYSQAIYQHPSSAPPPQLAQEARRDNGIPLSFRALPLLASDLPNTQIQVTNSSIRPNDRGKDVLSFIVFVSPGSNKEPWRVEKLYSDVIALDQRMRAQVARNVLKKIGTLPEPKLWKDHAPAKVDQRKAALEMYLQSLIQLSIKNKDEIIAFFTSDIVREAKKPVMQPGHKEGYLTKRGKNFGGWKSRYFVLQGPILEYYESRGGAHLGSINVTGAQIGRQQKTSDKAASDDEKEYRHAFLIVEAKKGPGGNHARHVLCAESDEDRDSWVDILVRYFSGSYGDDGPIESNLASPIRHAPARNMSTDDIQIQKGPAIPLSQLPADASNAKLFRPIPHIDDATATSEFSGADPSTVRESIDVESPTSCPRANSSQSQYLDHDGIDRRLGSIDQHREGDHLGKVLQPSHHLPERSPSPEKPDSRSKISRPMNGVPIPSGFKFGRQDSPAESSPSSSDRREKAKSRSFWGFGRPNEKAPLQQIPVFASRAVFGVSLEESIDVAQMAGLPAIVFRCIKYLEAKKAEEEEGIYRLSGSSAVIKNLKDRFNTEGDVDLLVSDEDWDPHAIAGLLKGFLRELPTSILTRDLHLRFLAVIDFVDPQERIQELSYLIGSLPIANYTLLRALTAHLILIVQNSALNKMTMRNVGIVFSPTLGIPAGVFSLMLGEFNRVFNVNNEEEDGSGSSSSHLDADANRSSPIIRRNSKQYSDAAADQLLGISGRALLVTTEEGQSDTDGMSVQDESGLDTTDGEDVGLESTASSPALESQDHLDIPDTPTATSQLKVTKAHTAAASRGLNIATSGRGNRHSRVMGLPTSPRPPTTPDISSSTVPVSPNQAGFR